MNKNKMKIAAALVAIGMSAAACTDDATIDVVVDEVSAEADAAEGETVEDEAMDDEASGDEAMEDEAMEDDASGDEAMEDGAADDAAMEDDAAGDDAMEDDAAAAESVVAIAQGSPDHTVLVEAVVAADLAGALSEPGPFTVFAPTDDAFVAALDALGLTKEELLADTELLTSVLTFHVVPASAMAGDLSDGQTLPTLNGEELVVAIDGDAVTINGANVVAADLKAENGVVHVVDTVLVPAAE